MKANFYSSVIFQTEFSEDDQIFGVSELYEDAFGKSANSIKLFGKTDEHLEEVVVTGLIVEKFTFDANERTEYFIKLSKAQQEDPYEVISKLLETEFGLDYGDDDQEMIIDSIADSILSPRDFTPSNLGKLFESKGTLEIKKMKSSQASKINFLLQRISAFSNELIEFGNAPSIASAIKLINKKEQDEILYWLDKYETMVLGMKS